MASDLLTCEAKPKPVVLAAFLMGVVGLLFGVWIGLWWQGAGWALLAQTWVTIAVVLVLGMNWRRLPAGCLSFDGQHWHWRNRRLLCPPEPVLRLTTGCLMRLYLTVQERCWVWVPHDGLDAHALYRCLGRAAKT